MGMDGLSMANTGIPKESTSAEYTARSEQIIQQDPNNNTKQVQTLSTNQQVREKEEPEEEGKKKRNSDEQEENIDDAVDVDIENEDNSENAGDFNIEDLENPNKDFYVKLNPKDDIIELYESSTSRLIESISGNELQSLVKKLNMASGIFINKKV